MFSVFLSSYRNTSGSLGELEKAASRSLKFPLVDINTGNMFSIP